MWFAFYFTGIIAALAMSVYYSVTARRRGIHPLESRMTLGKMNVALGLLMLLFGANQYTFEDLTTVRIVIGALLMFVGAVNFYLGGKNYVNYRREWMMELKKQA
ncbi:YtpI family protein [Brevibacillus dissolubilis]|uniref:YtpI family protein n=1 Tax=Brevibacillus dissolubilis TaxID=1844116 RepID=UPI0011160458|nr:YtpI family protein [Brevibacillus dissolubilis]